MIIIKITWQARSIDTISFTRHHKQEWYTSNYDITVTDRKSLNGTKAQMVTMAFMTPKARMTR